MADWSLETGSFLLAITPADAARHPRRGSLWLSGLREGLERALGPEPDAPPPVVVQVRDKQASDAQIARLLALVGRSLPDLPVLLNGSPVRAEALGFDGYHRVASDQEAVQHITTGRRRLLVGQSSHSLQEARRAVELGVDYVVFGPVFDTPSKRAFGPPQGLATLQRVCSSISRPVVGVGGIDGDRAERVLQAGAAGIAAIRAAGDPLQVQRMIQALRRHRPPHHVDRTEPAPSS